MMSADCPAPAPGPSAMAQNSQSSAERRREGDALASLLSPPQAMGGGSFAAGLLPYHAPATGLGLGAQEMNLLLQQSLLGLGGLGADLGMMGGAPPLPSVEVEANGAVSASPPFERVESVSVPPIDDLAASFAAGKQGLEKPSLDLPALPQLPQVMPSVATDAGPSQASIFATSTSDHDDPGWDEQYRALRAYKAEFGHTRVPARYKANPKLGRWVMTQRRQFTLLMQVLPSALTAERIRRLEEIGFTWSVRPEPTSTWNKRFQELKAYKAQYGNTMVPQRYQYNQPLGTWVHTQRRQHKLLKEGKKNSMTAEKEAALDSIGFEWDAKRAGDKSARKKKLVRGVSDTSSQSSGQGSGPMPVVVQIQESL